MPVCSGRGKPSERVISTPEPTLKQPSGEEAEDVGPTTTGELQR